MQPPVDLERERERERETPFVQMTEYNLIWGHEIACSLGC